MTTWSKIQSALPSHCKPKYIHGRGEWEMNNPLDASSDSHSFNIKVDADGEHGAYHYFAGGIENSGSLYELAAKLNIDVPKSSSNGASKSSNNGKLAERPQANERIQLARTHEQWAADHGGTVETFTKCNWEAKTHNQRPAWKIKHEDGIYRIHHIDGEKPKAYPIKPEDHKGTIAACWYGFDRAVAMATKAPHKTIVLCNGQPSVVVGMSFGVPALAQTGGEKAAIIPALLRRLLQAIKDNDLKIMLVFDGDEAGRNSTDGIQKQLSAQGIIPQVVSFGGDDGYDLADHCKRYKDRAFSKLQTLASFNIDVVKRVHCSDDLQTEFADFMMVTEDHIVPGEYLLTPFASMHKLGGFSHILEPGKMTGLLAPSGYGKTSWFDSWIEVFLKKGFDILSYSPEWTPQQQHWRRIQRYGSATYDQIRLHSLWTSEDKKGIPDAQKEGVRMRKDSELYQRTLQVNNKTLGSFPGKIKYFTGDSATEEILKDMTNQVALLRRYGRRVGLAVFDYAQLLDTVKVVNGKNSYEVICDLIKKWSMKNHVHSCVGIQVTKERAKAAIENDKLLTEYDASWIRPDVFNLMLSLNIQHATDPNTQELYKLRTAKINVCKNNSGQTGVLKMKTDFPRLQWVDESWA